MENALLVFVSSTMGDLQAERRVVKEALEAISLTRPWVFEYSPASTDLMQKAYLSKAMDCDIFLLIVGQEVSQAVHEEYQVAVDNSKPILAFLKKVRFRSNEATRFINRLRVKWVEFVGPSDLRRLVQEAVSDELVKRFRQFRLSVADESNLTRFRNILARVEAEDRVTFMPEAEQNLYRRLIAQLGNMGFVFDPRVVTPHEINKQLDEINRIFGLLYLGAITLSEGAGVVLHPIFKIRANFQAEAIKEELDSIAPLFDVVAFKYYYLRPIVMSALTADHLAFDEIKMRADSCYEVMKRLKPYAGKGLLSILQEQIIAGFCLLIFFNREQCLEFKSTILSKCMHLDVLRRIFVMPLVCNVPDKQFYEPVTAKMPSTWLDRLQKLDTKLRSSYPNLTDRLAAYEKRKRLKEWGFDIADLSKIFE